MPKVLHPHVTTNPAICGGRSHVTGTRFSVHRVHVHPLVAVMLRERGVDCRTTREAGNLGGSDEDQLHYATAQGRVLLTLAGETF